MHLNGAHAKTSDSDFHGLGRAGLSAPDVMHPFHGVTSFGPTAGDIVSRCRQFEPLLRRGQVFSHLTAIALFGAPLPRLPSDELHVANLGNPSRSRTAGIIGHRMSLATGVSLVHGLPVVAAADAWCQVAAMVHPNDLIAVGDFLVSGVRLPGGGRTTALCTFEDLDRACTRNLRGRGARSRAMALPRLRTDVDSRMESLLRLCLVDAGFPEPETGAEILVDAGRLALHPDLYWPRGRIVIEYEGEHHGLPERFRRDILRRELFEAAGYHVLQVTSHDLFVDRAAFMRRVRDVRARFVR